MTTTPPQDSEYPSAQEIEVWLKEYFSPAGHRHMRYEEFLAMKACDWTRDQAKPAVLIHDEGCKCDPAKNGCAAEPCSSPDYQYDRHLGISYCHRCGHDRACHRDPIP